MTPRRPSSLGSIMALAGAAALLGMPAQANLGSSAPQPTREYVAPSRQRLAEKKKKAQAKKDDPPTKRYPGRWSRRKSHRRWVGETRSQKWQDRKDGSAIDGRGDHRSAKRLLRARWCARFGVSSGRQWKRLRRALRRQVKELQGATQ